MIICDDRSVRVFTSYYLDQLTNKLLLAIFRETEKEAQKVEKQKRGFDLYTIALVSVLLAVGAIGLMVHFCPDVLVSKEFKLGKSDASLFWSLSDNEKEEMMIGKNENYLEGLGWRYPQSRDRGRIVPVLKIDTNGDIWIMWVDNKEQASRRTVFDLDRVTDGEKAVFRFPPSQ